MKFLKKASVLLSIAALASSGLTAQESFDLSSQRSEKQSFRRVPGEKVDHKGLIINPTPQQINIDPGKTVSFVNGFAPSNKTAKQYTDDYLHLNIPTDPSGLKLDIEYGDKKARKAGVEEKTGAYSLKINGKGVKIVAFDDRGVFYALQSLRQIIESPIAANKTIPYITINDYPDLKYRGVVEGFYGVPWSHDVRKSLIEYYGRNKMDTYVFGPKDDPYHSSPYWRLPYPEEQAEQIRDLVDACKRNRVEFVWAIHPGKDIRWDEADYDSLLNKFNMMYDLGVRGFAIFFDDIEGIGTNPVKQAELLNRLNNDFVKTKNDVANLVVCPTDYSRLWASPKPDGPLATYGNMLDPSVEVFYTGDVVCSDLTHDTMDFFNNLVKRPGYFWWNYPVTDYCRNYILQGPVYGLDTTMTANDLVGFLSNPMEHGEASKLALYSVADYSWNVNDYNPIDSWERALDDLAPKAKEAYRTFAIHSADTETGYRRDESWETETFPYNKYTQEQFDNLFAEFSKIEKVPAVMEENCDNDMLLDELRPWLIEFGKLGTRGKNTLQLIKLSEDANLSDFWAAYVNNLMSDKELTEYTAHKSGTMKLQPFYENTMDDLLEAFYKKLTGRQAAIYKGISSFRNINTNLSKLMLDNDTTTFYTSANGQRPGSWIGVDLREVRPVSEIDIRQGRNSIDDVDYFDHVILEVSSDGKNWTALTDSLVKTYDIKWSGEPIDARYVRLKRLDSPKQNWAAIRTFRVNPPTQENVAREIQGSDAGRALMMFDDNPATFFDLTGPVSFSLKEGQGNPTMLLDLNNGQLTVLQLDKDGKILSEENVTTQLFTPTLHPEAKRIELTGEARIYEIVS